jgi:hypothetical protein
MNILYAGAHDCLQLDPGHLSAPQKIEFPTEGGKTAFMLYYPPRNREYEYPQGTLPPLVSEQM